MIIPNFSMRWPLIRVLVVLVTLLLGGELEAVAQSNEITESKQVVPGRYKGSGGTIVMKGKPGPVVVASPGTSFEDYSFTIDEGVLKPQGVHFKEVKFRVQLGGKLHATDSILEECNMWKTGAWYSSFTSKWEFTNCVISESMMGKISQVDFGVKFNRCTFHGIDLPRITYKGAPENERNHQWRTINECRFVKCKVPQSFLIATKDCVFEDCQILSDADYKDIQSPFEVAFVVLDGRGTVKSGSDLVTFTISGVDTGAGAEFKSRYSGGSLTVEGFPQVEGAVAKMIEVNPLVPEEESATISAPKTETTTKPPAIVVTGMENAPEVLMLGKQAGVKGLLVMDLEGSRFAGAASQMSAIALPSTADKPVAVGFNQAVGESMEIALKEVLKCLQLRHDGWPRGKSVEIAFEDKYSDKDGPSAAVACGLLLESLITGVPLDSSFAVTGDMNADGSVQPIGGVAAKIRGAAKRDCKVVAIPLKNERALSDLIVMEGIGPLLPIQVFTISNFEEALTLASSERSAELEKSLAEFELIQEVFRRPGANVSALLRNPKVQEKLQLVVQGTPNHLSARLMLEAGQGRAPTMLSIGGSLDEIDNSTAVLLRLVGTNPNDLDALSTDQVADAVSDLQRLRIKLDRRAWPYADAITDFGKLVREWQSNRPSSYPARKKLADQVVAAASKCDREIENLRADPDVMEELLD